MAVAAAAFAPVAVVVAAAVLPSPESVVCVLLALDAVDRFLFRIAAAADAATLGLISFGLLRDVPAISRLSRPESDAVNGIEVVALLLHRKRKRKMRVRKTVEKSALKSKLE